MRWVFPLSSHSASIQSVSLTLSYFDFGDVRWRSLLIGDSKVIDSSQENIPNIANYKKKELKDLIGDLFD